MGILQKFLFLGICLLSFLDRLAVFHPHLDLLSHFKMQFCIAIFLGLLPLIWKKSWKTIFIGLIALGLNLYQILPWYVPAQSSLSQAQTSRPLKILLANVFFDNHQVDALHKLIQDQAPDLVVLQEANRDQIQMMQTFGQEFPYSFRPPEFTSFGLGLWSRYPIQQARFLLLADAELPSLSGTLDMGSQQIHLFTTHLSSPIRKPAIYRNRQLNALGQHLKAQTNSLVLGDFNTSMWSPFYQALESQTGLANCRLGFGVLPSWPAQLPTWARIPIDQCLISPNLHIKEIFLGNNIGSDHLPLIITVMIPDASAQQ